MDFNRVLDDACVCVAFCFIFWVVFTTITRHLTARSYNSMQEKVFEKLNAAPAIAELAATGALQTFLASLTPEKPAQTGPAERILRGIQAGIVILCVGITCFVLGPYLEHKGNFLDYRTGSNFYIFGIGAFGLGLGFIIAALASVWISRKLGLLDREPRA